MLSSGLLPGALGVHNPTQCCRKSRLRACQSMLALCNSTALSGKGGRVSRARLRPKLLCLKYAASTDLDFRRALLRSPLDRQLSTRSTERRSSEDRVSLHPMQQESCFLPSVAWSVSAQFGLDSSLDLCVCRTGFAAMARASTMEQSSCGPQ